MFHVVHKRCLLCQMPGVSEGMQAMSAAAVVDALTADVGDPDALLLDAGGVDGADLTTSAEFAADPVFIK